MDVKNGKKTYTYRELNHLTGISIPTLSRVFNRSEAVSDSTRERVLEALREIGYETDELAVKKSLRQPTIVFNIPSYENPFYSPIIQGAIDAAERSRFNLVVNSSMLSTKEELEGFLSLMRCINASGTILTNALTPEMLHAISSEIPTVQCTECLADQDVPFVTIHDSLAAKTAVNHLLSIGRKRVAFLNGPTTYKYARERLDGYRSALIEAGIGYDRSIISELPRISYNLALSAAHQILNSPVRPDAFFTASDTLGVAVMKASERLGLKVPRDVAVVGFDNIEISSMSTPSLTTINQPTTQLGMLAVDLLIKVINGEELSMSKMWLDAELIVRESTSVL